VAKKKKSVELSDQKITFNILKVSYKVIRYYPTSMELDVMVYEDDVKIGMQKIAFAHVPKEIKRIIKPN